MGVKCANIDIETGEQLSHREIYGRAIERLGGLDTVIPHIPFYNRRVPQAKYGERSNPLPAERKEIKKWKHH